MWIIPSPTIKSQSPIHWNKLKNLIIYYLLKTVAKINYLIQLENNFKTTLSWPKFPPKVDTKTKASVQIVHLRRDSCKQELGSGQMKHTERRLIGCMIIDPVTAMGEWHLSLPGLLRSPLKCISELCSLGCEWRKNFYSLALHPIGQA